ncbi:MAG: hypothetical protein WAO08_14995 [Hyphomicrobiaceae bacterium]
MTVRTPLLTVPLDQLKGPWSRVDGIRTHRGKLNRVTVELELDAIGRALKQPARSWMTS